MEKQFYTSTEAAEITRCTRRQLQYWRDNGVVVPTGNTTGKGRNVYYSISDLLALKVMEYLLSIGLNLAEFDEEKAIAAVRSGQAVIPVWTEIVRKQLQERLKLFGK